MTRDQIRVALYKEKPEAKLQYEFVGVRGSLKVYKATTSLGEHLFSVPITDMGEKQFEDVLPAQLLSRWIVMGDKAPNEL